MTVDSPPEPDEHASLTRSTVKSVAWITGGRLLKAPLNLLSVAVLARLLTPSDFGIVALGALVVSLANVLVDGSFGMVLIQRRTVAPSVIGATLILSSSIAVLLAVGMVLGAPYIQQEFDFPHLREVLVILGLMLPITAVTTITTALLQRAMMFGALTVNQIASQLTYTTVAIALAVAGWGLWSLVWAQAAYFVVESLLGFLVVRKRYQVTFALSEVGNVFRSGGMFTISKLLNWAAMSADTVVIGRFLGPTQLGFYSRPATLMNTARQVSGAGPTRVLFSTFAKLQHDKERMLRAYYRSLSMASVAASFVSLFVVFNAEIIVRVLLGPRWLATIPLTQIVFSAFIARSGYVVAEAVPLALGLGGQSAIRQGAQLVLIVAGAAIGARFGLIPAVWGICTAYWVFYLLCLLLVRRLIDSSWTEVLLIHLKGLVLMVPAVAGTVLWRLVIPGRSIVMELVPPTIFAVVAFATLALASDRLVGEDITRARRHIGKILLPYLPRFARA